MYHMYKLLLKPWKKVGYITNGDYWALFDRTALRDIEELIAMSILNQ